jgi:hypothetical protein
MLADVLAKKQLATLESSITVGQAGSQRTLRYQRALTRRTLEWSNSPTKLLDSIPVCKTALHGGENSRRKVSNVVIESTAAKSRITKFSGFICFFESWVCFGVRDLPRD